VRGHFQAPMALMALLLSAATPARAQRTGITLDQAIALARRVNPDVIQAQGDYGFAASSVRNAWAQYLPNLTGTADAGQSFFPESGSRPDPVTGELIGGTSSNKSYGFGLSSSLTLFDGFSRENGLASARADQEAADSRLSNRRWQAAAATSTEFYNALEAQGIVLVRQDELERAREQFAVAVGKLQSGAATVSDSLRAILIVNRARIQLMQANDQLAAAEANLARNVGLPGRVQAVDDSSFYLITALSDTASLRALATSEAPAVTAAEASMRARRAALAAAKGSYWPTVSIDGSTRYSGSQASGYDMINNSSVGVTVRWPLFDRFGRERSVDQSVASYDAAYARWEDERRRIDAELTAQLASLETALRRIELSDINVRAARADLAVQAERYRLGSILIDNLQNSQDALSRAEIEALRARMDYLRTRARISALVGRELD